MKASGTALVTGASRGLGRSIALQLAREGFDVVATMRRPDDGRTLAGELGGAAGSLRVESLDVTAPSGMELPPDLRVLVNNAGTERAYLPVEATPQQDWRDIFETNVFGAVEMARRAVPVLRGNGGGVICNVTSASLVMSVPFYSAYRASKAALQAFGESLRAEVAPFGIRVVEVLPGPIDTDMLAGSDRVPEAAGIAGYEELAAALHAGRSGIGPFTTAPGAAAEAVCRAILAEDGPLRWPCDELGGQLLAAWQRDPEGTLGAGATGTA